MARLTSPLTDTQIKTAKPQRKDYSLSDGSGLYLLIKSTGSKIWRFNYYRPTTKARALISFGGYPQVTLQQARKRRDEVRELIVSGKDPLEHKRETEQQKRDELNNTFERIAQNWFKVKSHSNLKSDTLKDIWRSLELHVFPSIGDQPIVTLKAKHFISALQPIKDKGSLETVKRLIQRINEIMYYAVNVGILRQIRRLK